MHDFLSCLVLSYLNRYLISTCLVLSFFFSFLFFSFLILSYIKQYYLISILSNYSASLIIRTSIIRTPIIWTPNLVASRAQLSPFFRGNKLMKFSFRWVFNFVDKFCCYYDNKNQTQKVVIFFSAVVFSSSMPRNCPGLRGHEKGWKGHLWLSEFSVCPNGPTLNWAQPVQIIEDALYLALSCHVFVFTLCLSCLYCICVFN